MQRLCEVFSGLALEEASQFSAVSLIDSKCEPERHTRMVHYTSFLGAGSSRRTFIRQLFGVAIKHPGETLILGHVSLAPLGQALRYLKLIRSYVVVLHGIEAWRRLRLPERISCKAADRIVATTRFTKFQFAEKNDVSAERISIVPLAVERVSLDETAPERPTEGPLRLLFVGRLWACERYKGLDELLDAVALLSCDGLSMHLKVIGTGDDLPRFREKACALGIQHSVEFAGTVDREGLSHAYAQCDLFVLPSRGEGFGIAYLEAMSCAKACIGACSGGVPEVIDDRCDGFLVHYGDVAELAERIRELANDRDLLSVFGRRAQAKVREKYLFGNMLANWRMLMRASSAHESSESHQIICAG